jgi:hypothetical protein
MNSRGIQIFLPNSPVEAITSIEHEEVMQQASKKEAMEPNDFKTICAYDAGAHRRKKSNKYCQRGGGGADTDVFPNKKGGACSFSHSVGYGSEFAGGLVEQSRTQKRTAKMHSYKEE